MSVFILYVCLSASHSLNVSLHAYLCVCVCVCVCVRVCVRACVRVSAVSTLISAVIDPADYTDSAVLSPTYSMYWKHLDGVSYMLHVLADNSFNDWTGLLNLGI